ncbi:MAG: dialkylresorcinol condensing enzyme [Candidatus Dactylopiibacterium sp.]|nr:dialkylresorcinol condensing enzyme [Candidatus Dactylopiibacterium sp.]
MVLSPEPDAPHARPVKRVLVLSYSQTGQLAAITRSILAPLQADPRVAVHIEPLQPLPAFPYPWPLRRFFDAFPESAGLAPAPLAPLTLRGDEAFDLVILPWQVWFLAPSQPVTAFLQHPLAARLLAGKPVVSVIACRNMWMLAFEKFRQLLTGCQARLCDNVVLTDRSPTLVTLVTTPLWLLTGRRQALRWLPRAGVSDTEIARCERFGRALAEALAADRERDAAPLLAGLDAVRADPRLYASECAGTRSFRAWGRLLRAAGGPGAPRRQALVYAYLVFLVLMILCVVPFSLAAQALVRPLLARRLAALKARFEFPSGSGTERLTHYES